MQPPIGTIPDLTPEQLAAMPLTCDTCGAEQEPMWQFPHPEAWLDVPNLKHRIHMEAGHWGACDACAELLRQRDAQGLINRAIEAHCQDGNFGAVPAFRAIHLHLVKTADLDNAELRSAR